MALNHHEQWLRAYAAYQFVVFYLPPPSADSDFGENYWTAEMIDLLPCVEGQNFTNIADIDSNSGTWKIVFVVTAYATNDDWFNHNNTWTYQYQGQLPQTTTSTHEKE